MLKCYPRLAGPLAKGEKAQAVMVIIGVELQRVAKGLRGEVNTEGVETFPLHRENHCYFERILLSSYAALISSTTSALLKSSQAI